MKLIVLGSARHGKDTVCEMLAEQTGLKFISSSLFVAERVVMPFLKENFGVEYPSVEHAYADRATRRVSWFNAIAVYNREDPARLGKELLAEYDIYCGLRSLREYVALYKAAAFDACIWVERPGFPAEAKDSCTVTPNLADFTIINDSDLEALALQVELAYSRCQRLVANRRNPLEMLMAGWK